MLNINLVLRLEENGRQQEEVINNCEKMEEGTIPKPALLKPRDRDKVSNLFKAWNKYAYR